MALSKLDDTGPTPAQRPRSVVTTSWSSPMVEHHAGNLPRTHLRGTCEHLLLLVLPRPTDRHLALDQLPWSARRRARRPSLCACEAAAAQVCRRHSCQPCTGDARPSLPARPDSGSDDQAARGPQRHVEPAAPKRGLPRRTDAFQDPARCGQRGRGGRGHRTRVRPDTSECTGRGHRSPGHRTSARPVGRTRGRRTEDRTERRTAWPASGHLRRPRRRRPPAGRRKPPR
jgi:hypothetical protein